MSRHDDSPTLITRLLDLRAVCAELRVAQRTGNWIARVPDLTLTLLKADRAIFFVLNRQGTGDRQRQVVAGSIPGPPTDHWLEDALAARVAAETARRGASLSLSGDNLDAFMPEVAVEGQTRPRSALSVTLTEGREIQGVLYAHRLAGEAFAEADLRLLEVLADQVANGLGQAETATQSDGSEFVSLVTHQLRVPLTAMVGYTDLLLGGMAGSLTERQASFLTTIKRNMGRMNRLIDDLSALNQLESGRMRFRRRRAMVPQILERAMEPLEQLISDRQQTVSLEAESDLPAVRVDTQRLAQVVTLLVENASLYSDPGTTIGVQAERLRDGVSLEVKDQGIGISEDDQKELFRPFFRSDDDLVRAHEGWGLSLALAAHIVQAEGGRLTCESVQGQGSTFTLTLPAADVAESIERQ